MTVDGAMQTPDGSVRVDAVSAGRRYWCAVLAGEMSVAGAPIGDELVVGWTGAVPVTLRTLQRAFAGELTPAAGRSGGRVGDYFTAQSIVVPSTVLPAFG